MRILHVSHTGLNNPRIERMAQTMAKQGHTLLFLGGAPVTRKSVFDETRSLPIPSGLRILYDSNVKKRWLKEITSFKPDIVHAHNIITGHFLLDSELPTIFDDHEVLSKQPFMYASRPFIRRMAAKVLWRHLPKWEKDMALRFPIITISEGLANYYRQYSSNVEVVVNTPSLNEVEWLENFPQRKGLVYIGGDFSLKKFNPYRDMSGLRDLLEFDIISGFPHDEMMKRLTHYRIGLTPFKPTFEKQV
ncbi:MAG: glycosyltransferase [Candidatus Thorarchaeota archaeon]